MRSGRLCDYEILRSMRTAAVVDEVSIPRRTWELAQIETHNLRQLVGIILMNCQLAERGSATYQESCRRTVEAIESQQSQHLDDFLYMFHGVAGK